MLSLFARRVVPCVVLLAACGSPPPSTDPSAGIAEGTSGVYEITVVDLDSREALPGAVVVLRPFLGTEQMTSVGENGTASFPREGMGVFSVDASASGHVPARWTGIVGGRVIIPLRATTGRNPFEVDVSGLADDETAIVTITTRPALFQPSSVRVAGASGTTLGACEPSATGSCSASIVADDAATGRIVLIAVSDETGAARRLVRFDGVTSGTTLDLATGSDLALETLTGTVPTPPAGLTAVVGVPGISFGAAVGVLGFSGDGSVALPVVTGMLATRWALFVAQANMAGTPDPSRRSVLVDRRAESDLGPWTEWMTPPQLAPGVARTALLVGSPGAVVHVIDWIDGDDVLHTDLVFDPDVVLSVPENADSARVRAIDTTGDEVDLDLDAAERATVRFAEHDRDLL